jgi:hypothetical protein
MVCPKKGLYFEFSPAQMFGALVFKPSSKIKGLELMHTAGAGKSCSAVNILSNFAHVDEQKRWRIIWVTRSKLKKEPEGALFDDVCVQKIRDSMNNNNDVWGSGQNKYKTKVEKSKLLKTSGNSRSAILKNKFGILFAKKDVVTYDQLVQMILGRETQANYKVSAAKPFGYKTLFIMDEIHNLVSKELPAEERKWLDMKFDTKHKQVIIDKSAIRASTRKWLQTNFKSGINLNGKVFKSKKDVYGTTSGIKDGMLEGRDLIVAMFHQSDRLSKQNSCKRLGLTATPLNQPWLLNVYQDGNMNNNIIDTNLSNYMDPVTKSLKRLKMQQFSKASQGHISYLNLSDNPTFFSRKVFNSVIRTNMMEFHAQHLQNIIKDSKNVVVDIQDSTIISKIRGPFYNIDQIKTYEAQVKKLRNWTPEKERKIQQDKYMANIQKATEVFKLNIKASHISKYNSKVTKYKKWLKKNSNTIPPGLVDVLNSNNELIPFFEWQQKPLLQEFKSFSTIDHNASYNSSLNIPKKVQELYIHLSILHSEFESLKFLFFTGKLKKQPVMDPDLRYVVDEYDRLLDMNEFFDKMKSSKRHIQNISERTKSEYNKLVKEYKSVTLNNKTSKKTKKTKKTKQTVTILPKQLRSVLQNGKLVSLQDWFLRINQIKTKKKYSKNEQKYLEYVIEDPHTGLLRVKTMGEFIKAIKKPIPKLIGRPLQNKFSFWIWHNSFDAKVARQLIPYYLPQVYAIIKNIINVELYTQHKFGNGTKHQLFNFSTGKYGAGLILSAFAAFSEPMDEFPGFPGFKAIVSYKKIKGTNDKQMIITDSKKWGVTMMSSKPLRNVKRIPGNRANETQDNDYSSITTQKATQKAFNENNPHGNKIKIFILDGAFTEGISLYDVGAAHFVTPGLSKSQLTQAVARSSRNCKSQTLPFYKGVGAFLNLYFYELFDEHITNKTTYEQMMQHMDAKDKLQTNMTDIFSMVSQDMAFDRRLNNHINNFNPVYEGKIIGYEPMANHSYYIEMKLHQSNAINGKGKKSKQTFIISEDNVLHQFKVNDIVENIAHKSTTESKGVITAYNTYNHTFQVDYGTHKSTNDSLAVLRLPLKSIVKFKIPNGVDIASQVFNIADVNSFRQDQQSVDFNMDHLTIPDTALITVGSSFKGDVAYILLGLTALVDRLSDVLPTVKLSMVLPNVNQTWRTVPNWSDFALQWICNQDGSRDFIQNKSRDIIQRFLSPTTGVSILMLMLTTEVCGIQHSDNTAILPPHMNMLIYIPKYKTIERFDPMGRSFHNYDTIELDIRLSDLFKSKMPDVTYMSLAESSPLDGLQELQKMETKHNNNDMGMISKENFGPAYVLFYLHTRLLFMMKESQDSKSQGINEPLVFPMQFQMALIRQMTMEYKGQMTAFIRGYADDLKTTTNSVTSWNLYDEHKPLWNNVVRYLKNQLNNRTPKLLQQRKSRQHRQNDNKINDLLQKIKFW